MRADSNGFVKQNSMIKPTDYTVLFLSISLFRNKYERWTIKQKQTTSKVFSLSSIRYKELLRI